MCERARRWSSLRVDGELSELESALLDNHLGRCSSCRAFARGAEDRRRRPRAARLERPAPLALVLPPRGRLRAVGRTSLAAAAVAAASVAATLAGVTVGRHAHAVSPGRSRWSPASTRRTSCASSAGRCSDRAVPDDPA